MIPIVKEARVELTLRIVVFVADITQEFILGLDILRVYDATEVAGRHVL
jgi:hypothetical protein